MTVNASPSFIVHNGDGVSTVFPVPFYVQVDADIYAARFDTATLAASELVLGTDYTVQNAGSQSGCQITMISGAPPTGSSIYIDRSNIIVDQQTDYVQNDKFPSQSTESALDKLTMIAQLLRNASTSAIRYPQFEFRDGVLPQAVERANTVFGFDESGNQTLLPMPASVGAGDLLEDEFTADVDYTPGVTASLTLSRAYGTKANISVHFDSAYQGPDQIASLNDKILTFTAPIPEGVQKVYVKGGTTLSLFVAPDDSIGDNKIATGSRVYIRSRNLYFAQDYGAVGDGVQSDLAAINAGIAAMQSLPGGGKLILPAGTYRLPGTLTLDPVSPGWHKVVLSGDGPMGTVLDFSDAAPTSDGIAVNGWGGRFGIERLQISGAPGHGLNIGANSTRGDPNTTNSRFFVDDVLIDSCGRDGFRMCNTYVLSLRGIESRNNGQWGFRFFGYHDAMHVTRCWAGGDGASPNGGNGAGGWWVNGVAYSDFTANSADWNAGPGWILENVASTTFKGNGSEKNSQEGLFLLTRLTNADGLPSAIIGIQGLEVDGFLAKENSQTGADLYANFLGCVAASNIPINVTVKNGVDILKSGQTVSVFMNGTNGPVRVRRVDTEFAGTVGGSGSRDIQNQSVVGRTMLVLLSAAQAIPTGSATAVNFDTITTNRLGGALVAGAVQLPNGVGRVRVTAGVYWDSDSNGYRYAQILKNGVSVPGLPQEKVVPNLFTPQNLTSAIIEVGQNDTIGVAVQQTASGPLNVLANTATWLAVEAIG